MNHLTKILLQADGQVYGRNWIIWFAMLIVIAASWFAWHRNRKNVRKNKDAKRNNDTGEVLM
jgi:HAMP domain-containing protein